MAVPSLLKRICTGFFENCSANFPLNDTFPGSSIVICIATRVTGGVTTTQNSSSDMFFRSNIAFTLFLYILEQIICVPTVCSVATRIWHCLRLSNQPLMQYAKHYKDYHRDPSYSQLQYESGWIHSVREMVTISALLVRFISVLLI